MLGLLPGVKVRVFSGLSVEILPEPHGGMKKALQIGRIELWANAPGSWQLVGAAGTIFCASMHYALVPLLITRSFAAQSDFVGLVGGRAGALTFDALVARDELRLQRVRERGARKQVALLDVRAAAAAQL